MKSHIFNIIAVVALVLALLCAGVLYFVVKRVAEVTAIMGNPKAFVQFVDYSIEQAQK